MSRRMLVIVAVLATLAPAVPAGAAGTLTVERLDSFNADGAEISAFSKNANRLFVTDGDGVDVYDVSSSGELAFTTRIDTAGGVNSVAVRNRTVAIAVEGDDTADPGTVVFYDAKTLRQTGEVTVGVLPDMVTFTPNGRFVLTADEGEPSDDYTVDPEGSISVIVMRGTRPVDVMTADFSAYNSQEDALVASGVRIFGPGATVAQDLEPEYIAISNNSKTAYVTLQENNALAVVDIPSATVQVVLPLGFKDHSLPGNELDPSDRDGGIDIGSWPVFGMYQPDAIGFYAGYLYTANEGDARDYDGFSEEERVKDLTLDDLVFSPGTQSDANLGRLNITTTLGDTDGDGEFEELYAYGARSFSVWDASDGSLVYDSGAALEELYEDLSPTLFNIDIVDEEINETGEEGEDGLVDGNGIDRRSDNKGPEPEGLTIGEVDGIPYLFVGLERTSGIAVYSLANPAQPSLVTLIQPEQPVEGDVLEDFAVSPEGLTFVAADASPTGEALLFVTFEVTGYVVVYELTG